MITHLPEMFQLQRIPWQFFGTITFREAFLREHEAGQAAARRANMFIKWGRLAYHKLKYSKESFHKSLNCRRLERGEIGGLWHVHWLMSGLKPEQVNKGTAKFLSWQWRAIKGGHCTVDVFDTRQNGVEYIAKCLDPAKRYEFNRFALAQTLTFSPALLKVLRADEQVGFSRVCQRGARMQRFATSENSHLGRTAG